MDMTEISVAVDYSHQVVSIKKLVTAAVWLVHRPVET
jgi:hypothetical protein